MENFCNNTVLNFVCSPYAASVVFWLLCAVLFLSIILNFICCIMKFSSGKETCAKVRKSFHQFGSRSGRTSCQMEDNPIYGNLNYVQTSVAVYTESELCCSSISPASLGNLQRVTSDPQSRNQDCYANLTLKAPRQKAECISPQLQFSQEAHLEEPTESEREDNEENTDAVSTVSDLYAAVQAQRAKTIDCADGREEYANHL
ncbi:uncharacterized protein LOC101155763 [Oryzias latipes]|uniref:uncharacterized protein LOC101155763 n=1 Tax=Oryzias latipes TaxID=8090 RepID=UPI0000E9D16C|nr:uncharacterized protein LOC101155763 [Oryzias latipes]